MDNAQEQIIANVDRLYGASSQPAAVVDGGLLILWANAAAREHYGPLRTPDGICALLPSGRLRQLKAALAGGQAQSVSSEEIPYLCASLCFTPLGKPGEGALALVNFQPLPAESSGDSGSAHRMIAAFSGQIRGPLNQIFSLLSSLARRQGIRRSRSLYEPLVIINRQCYRILRHCINLTEFTRFGSALQKASPADCDLAAALQELCISAREKTRELGIPLEFTAKGPCPPCLCDSGMLQTAIFNILSNACRFTRAGNAIHISLEARGNRALIHIADRGMGIPEQALPHIFEPFFSLPDESGESGCGLGLTVAKMCMAAQGGGISVESREGQGTAVSLSLPLSAAPLQVLTLQAPRAADALFDRFSLLHILLSDVCAPPEPR